MRQFFDKYLSALMFGAGIALIIASIVGVSIYFNTTVSYKSEAYTPTQFYQAEVVDVVDPDSIIVDVDLGFNRTLYGASITLSDVDTSSISEVDGQRTVRFLNDRIGDSRVVLKVGGEDGTGQWYARVYRHGVDINQELIDRGLASSTEG